MAATGEEEGQQLQLTDVPDEILIRILSLLPTEDAVRTCLLVLRSGQWKSLTSLEFQEYDMLLRGSRFMNFVDRVMELRDHSVPLVSFSLRTEMENEDDDTYHIRTWIYHIRTWITKAGQCNVEELTVSIDDGFEDVKTSLYYCILECQSLVKLVLKKITIHVPSSSVMCLPCLKYMRLSYVRLVDDESTEKLLSSPLLEELIIDKCYWYNRSINACSPKLQVLNISEGYNDGYYYAKICIIGDNLKHFYYMGNLENEYQICAASSMQLSKVEVYVNKQMSEFYDVNCYNILKGLSGTRNLALSDYFLEGLQSYSELQDTIPIFECVTRLDIRVYKDICIDSLALMKVYERCPHLEYLNIGQLSHIVRNPQMNPVPPCFRTHLKKILLHYYVPGDEVDAAIDVLLNSAFVLEELVIYCKWDEDKGFHEGGHKIQELQDRLNQRPRVSKDCKISVRVTYANKSYLRSDLYYDNCYVKSMNES